MSVKSHPSNHWHSVSALYWFPNEWLLVSHAAEFPRQTHSCWFHLFRDKHWTWTCCLFLYLPHPIFMKAFDIQSVQLQTELASASLCSMQDTLIYKGRFNQRRSKDEWHVGAAIWSRFLWVMEKETEARRQNDGGINTKGRWEVRREGRWKKNIWDVWGRDGEDSFEELTHFTSWMLSSRDWRQCCPGWHCRGESFSAPYRNHSFLSNSLTTALIKAQAHNS